MSYGRLGSVYRQVPCRATDLHIPAREFNADTTADEAIRNASGAIRITVLPAELRF